MKNTSRDTARSHIGNCRREFKINQQGRPGSKGGRPEIPPGVPTAVAARPTRKGRGAAQSSDVRSVRRDLALRAARWHIKETGSAGLRIGIAAAAPAASGDPRVPGKL
jgi:hypothetical protein